MYTRSHYCGYIFIYHLTGLSIMQEHNTIREQDEYYCTKCGKRWGIHEGEPSCITDKQHRRAKSLDRVKQLRKEYFRK